MKKPELTQSHRRFETLVGDWKGVETIHETPATPAGQAEGRFFFRRILQGFFLTADWLERAEGEILMQGHGVIGWNAAKQEYSLHWFDNSGSPPSSPMKGAWEANTLAFYQKYPTHEGRTTFSLVGEKLTFKVEMTFEGNWKTVIEGEYGREP